MAIGAGGYAALGSTLDLVYYTDSKILSVGGITATNTTTAISTNTGALVVAGGAGIAGNLYVGGILSVTNGIISNTATNIAGGLAGQIVVQTGTGYTGFVSTGTVGTVLVSRGTGKPVFQNTLTLAGTTVASSPNTGALQVVGGVGIAGNLYVGSQSFINCTSGLSYPSYTAALVLQNDGSDTTALVLKNNANFGNNTTAIINYNGSMLLEGNNVTILSIASSTSTTTGALIVAGGVGIGGDVYVYGKIVAQELDIQLTTITTTLVITDDIISTYNTTDSTGTNSGALIVAGGVGIGKNLYVGGLVRFINTTAATSTTTGAVVVGGGMGIGGAVYINTTSFIAGSPILTVASLGGNVASITAGTDTAVSSSTGAVTIWNISTLQSVTNRGNSTTNAISITNTTSATSTTTGALQVSGGVGIGGILYANGFVFNPPNPLTGSVYVGVLPPNVSGSSDFGYNGGTDGIFDFTNFGTSSTSVTRFVASTTVLLSIFNTGTVVVHSKTTATSTNTGALQVVGGAGIGGDLWVGGNVYVLGTASNATAVNVAGGGVGQLLFQRATSSTYFVGTGTAGQLLISNGTTSTGPTFVSTTTITVATATTLAGGTLQSILYQSNTGTTSFLAAATTSGWILSSNGTGSPPSWVVGAGSATNADNIKTLATATNAAFYPTFVDSNNATGLYEPLYTTSTIIINPSTGKVGINVTPATGTDAKLQVTGGTTNVTTLLTAYSTAAVVVVPKSSSGYSLAIASGNGDCPQIQVSANGTASGDLLIQPYGGNVGIGTSSPAVILDIGKVYSGAGSTWAGGDDLLKLTALSGSAWAEPSIAFQEIGSNIGAKIGVKNTGNGAMEIIFANRNGSSTTSTMTERMRITVNGGLAFGGVSNYGSSGQILQSNGDAAPTWVPVSGTTAGTSTQVQTVLRTTNATHYLTFVDSNNSSATAESVYTTSSFTINPSTGNVLIGGTNVFGKTVSFSNFAGAGTQNFTASSGDTANGLKAGFSIYGTFEATPGDTSARRAADIWGGFSGGNWGNEFLSFGVGINASNDGQAQTTERMRITGAGKVCIGTTATISGALLTVNGAGYVAGNFTATGSLTVGVSTGSSVAGEIRATNEITAYFSSDARLKENIQPIENPIAMLEAIRGVYFDWTTEHIERRGGEDGYFVRKHDIGVIAQEVEKILPEIVATRSDGFKAVKYEKIVPLLIEAIKAQQAEIEQMKKLLK